MGGACATTTHLASGYELADSWASDGHKWLQTPYDCGYAIARDAEAHRRAITIAASYLPPVAEGDRDPTHFVPELSRRARGFVTWAMIRHLGRAGIATMVRGHCRLAVRCVTCRLVPGIEHALPNSPCVLFGNILAAAETAQPAAAIDTTAIVLIHCCRFCIMSPYVV